MTIIARHSLLFIAARVKQLMILRIVFSCSIWYYTLELTNPLPIRMKTSRSFAKDGFTLIELLVVIAIISILAAMLLPALSRAKQKAKAAQCISNNKQIAQALLMYAADYNDALPPLNTGTWPAITTNWWFKVLDSAGNYITASARSNNVWRCPAVMDADIIPAVVSYYMSPCEGYGPAEGNYITAGVFRYAINGTAPLGSIKLNAVKRTAQIWLIGDVGTPKTGGTMDVMPSGYVTEVTTKQPLPINGWVSAPNYKQPACRHGSRAIMSFCDGHVESWRWTDLRNDKDDIFAINSY